MKTIRHLLFPLLAGASAIVLIAAPGSEATRTIVLNAGDALRFNVTRIEAHPGERLRIELRNTGSLPKEVLGHNWVLLRPGQNPTSYASSALAAKSQGFEPTALAGEVIAAIPLVGRGETGAVTFDAPTEPGAYPFLCSYPAHCAAGMRGVLVVK